MDLALKRRLIGATVLIVLAIIFLPMLFNGSELGDTNTVSLDIPAPPERDYETRIVALDVPATPTGVADAVGVAANTEPSTEPMAPTVTEPAIGSGDTIATVDVASPPRVDAIPDPGATGQPSKNTDATANPGSTTTGLDTAAVAISTAEPVAVEPAPVMASSGRFVVNLGSYANVANAAQLESTLRSSGLAVTSEQIVADGKPVTRLRLGPYISRGLAENARLKAKTIRADLPLSIIEIDDSPSADVMVPNPARQGASAFAVQVEVLSDQIKANASRDRLRAAGFAAFVETLNTEKGRLYRVRVGPEADRSDAEKIKAGIRQRFGLDTIIVIYP